MIRIVLAIILFVSIIQSWWVLLLVLGIWGAWRYNLYIEVLIAGIIFDSLYGMVANQGVWGYIGTISAIVTLVFIGWFKRRVRT